MPINALGEEYAQVMVVDRVGMSGEQLERYEDESRSILGILRHSTVVNRQLDAVEFYELFESDKEGNPALMIEEVQLEVPNYRVHEIAENGRTKSVNGTIASCVGDFLTLGTNFNKLPLSSLYSHLISIQYGNRH